MPWIYHQATGDIYHDAKLVSSGNYAGKRPWQNHPEFEQLSDKGPLPKGRYAIEAPFHHPHTGAYSLHLTPSPGTPMFGRSGFFIHGPNAQHPDDSSDGCIVTDHATRVKIWASGDHQLEVVR